MEEQKIKEMKVRRIPNESRMKYYTKPLDYEVYMPKGKTKTYSQDEEFVLGQFVFFKHEGRYAFEPTREENYCYSQEELQTILQLLKQVNEKK